MKKREKKKFLAGLMSLIMILTLLPFNVFAAAPPDLNGHWAKVQVNKWLNEGLVSGYPDGSFKPEANITRAEFLVLVNNAFKIEKLESADFSDVRAGDWYYPAIAKASAAGYIKGYASGAIKPNDFITRQEAAIIIAKIKDLTENETTAEVFKDASVIPAWSKGAIGAVSAGQMMSGYPDGTFKPINYIKRAEAIAALDKAMNETVYDKPGTYGPEDTEETIEGNVTLTVEGISLQNLVIKGDLTLGEGIAEGDINLKNVTVKGVTQIKGGGEHSVIIADSSLNKVVIKKANGRIRVVANGSTNIEKATILSGAKLEESGLTGDGFVDVLIEADNNDEITLTGSFNDVTVNTSGVIVNLPGGTIVSSFTANAQVAVTGSGEIQAANVNESDVTFAKTPGKINYGDGVSTPANSGSSGSSGGGGGGSSSVSPVSNIAIHGTKITWQAPAGAAKFQVSIAKEGTSRQLEVTTPDIDLFDWTKAAGKNLSQGNYQVSIVALNSSNKKSASTISTVELTGETLAALAALKEFSSLEELGFAVERSTRNLEDLSEPAADQIISAVTEVKYQNEQVLHHLLTAAGVNENVLKAENNYGYAYLLYLAGDEEEVAGTPYENIINSTSGLGDLVNIGNTMFDMISGYVIDGGDITATAAQVAGLFTGLNEDPEGYKYFIHTIDMLTKLEREKLTAQGITEMPDQLVKALTAFYAYEATFITADAFYLADVKPVDEAVTEIKNTVGATLDLELTGKSHSPYRVSESAEGVTLDKLPPLKILVLEEYEHHPGHIMRTYLNDKIEGSFDYETQRLSLQINEAAQLLHGLAVYIAVDDGLPVTAEDVNKITVNPSTYIQWNKLADITVTDAGSGMMEGDGTAENPYLVTSAAQLNMVRNNLDKSYKLMADISLSGYAWEPIGGKGMEFTGTFDGNGKVISDLFIDGGEMPDNPGGGDGGHDHSSGSGSSGDEEVSIDYAGLFGYLGEGALVESLHLTDSHVMGKDYVGGIAGYNDGVIKNSSVTGMVMGSYYVGGIAGEGFGNIYNSHTEADVDGGWNVGGIIGDLRKNAEVRNSWSAGDISAYHLAGGIAGNVRGGKVINTYATGTVTGTAENGAGFGGIAGFVNSGGEIRNAYATGRVIAEKAGSYRIGGIVGIAGYNSKISNAAAMNEEVRGSGTADVGRVAGVVFPADPQYGNGPGVVDNSISWDEMICESIGEGDEDFYEDGTSVTWDELKEQELLEEQLGWDFEKVWVWVADQLPSLLADASIEDNEPDTGEAVEIDSVEALQDIANDLAGNYRLAANITLTEDWVPIGNAVDPFTGIFDGNGYAIKNLHITSSSDNTGLFGVAGETSVIKNLKMENVNITSTKNNVGAIAGYSKGLIKNVSVEGDVTGSYYVGGVAGRVSGTLEEAQANMQITANFYPGGIAGLLEAKAVIKNSYSAGNVRSVLSPTGTLGFMAGGIAGSVSGGLVENCYSTSDVYAANGMAGGIAGYVNSKGVVKNSFATGHVESPKTAIGGIVGQVQSESQVINNVALNISIIGGTNHIGRVVGYVNGTNTLQNNLSWTGIPVTSLGNFNDGAGKTVEELRDMDTYSDIGWDFDSIWTWDNQHDIPILGWQEDHFTGDLSHLTPVENTALFLEQVVTEPEIKEEIVPEENVTEDADLGETVSEEITPEEQAPPEEIVDEPVSGEETI